MLNPSLHCTAPTFLDAFPPETLIYKGGRAYIRRGSIFFNKQEWWSRHAHAFISSAFILIQATGLKTEFEELLVYGRTLHLQLQEI